MDEESKKLLQETHDMVKKMRDSQKNARMFKLIYWVVIIGLTYSSYLYMKPYLDQARKAYTDAQAQIQDLKNLGSGIKLP